jgi:hypothetical protein
MNTTDLVRLAIVRDPDGVEPDDYFFTTDLKASAADVAERYAARWTIEVCFRDARQDLGGHPQSWKRRGPERAAALSTWLHATIWCRHLTTHPPARPGRPGSGPEEPKITQALLDTLAYAASTQSGVKVHPRGAAPCQRLLFAQLAVTDASAKGL